jgi:biopolymer transport protein ExbB/TolQ
MDMNLVEIWSNMNGLVRSVVVLLTLEALGCITVVVDRVIMLGLSRRRSKHFAREAGPVLASGEYGEALEVAKRHSGSHLASFIETGVSVFLDKRDLGLGREKAAVFANRALERKGEDLSESHNRGMNVLASTGSTAPFIGLLGTVLGILNAFHMMAQGGSGGIATIGASIGEALVVTGYGLMVAIPAVLVFNYLSARIAKYEAGLANAGSELVDQLESGGGFDSRATSAGANAPLSADLRAASEPVAC